jgi:hypothetical protein
MAAKIIKTSFDRNGARRMINGRAYFGKWGKEYRLDRLDPDALSEVPLPPELQRGSTKSRVGGRIAHDLERLEPAETEKRRKLSEEFLKRPAQHFPAD